VEKDQAITEVDSDKATLSASRKWNHHFKKQKKAMQWR
jgi:hypothetical protein